MALVTQRATTASAPYEKVATLCDDPLKARRRRCRRTVLCSQVPAVASGAHQSSWILIQL
jgi:hypothetical protein